MVDQQTYVDAHVTAVRDAQRLLAEAEARDGGPTAEDQQRIADAVKHAEECRERRDLMARLAEQAKDADERAEMIAEVRGEVLTQTKETPLVVPDEPDLRKLGTDALEGKLGRVEIDFRAAAKVGELVKRGANRADVIAELERRALSVGTDTEGGHTVPTSTASNIYDYLQDIGGVMRAGATVITTASGEDLELPVNSGHNAPSGTLETTEGAAIAATEDTIGQVTLKAYKYTGGMDVSRELLTDTIADIEGFIIRGITRTISIKLETRLTLGTGSSMPKGVNHSPVAGNTTTTAASNLIGKNDIHTMKFALDPAYLGNIGECRWMMNSATYAHILNIQVGTGDARPLFQPSYIAGEPDMIMGAPVSYNNFMPGGIADNDQAVVFGHFGDGYVVRLAGMITIESSPHALFKNQQVAFIGSVRADGQIRDQRALRYLKIKA